jgi:hypothetical protein
MDASSLSEIQKTRFLAMNFARLQGLRVVPCGLLLFLVSLWANAQRGPARNFLLPVLMGLLCIGLYMLIDRYYRRAFGHVVASAESRRADQVLSIIGGAAALAAFLLDVRLSLPVSLVGLVFAIAILGEYIRFVRYAQPWYTLITPLFVLLIALVSVLPALGLHGWWQQIGVKAEMLGVCMAVSAILMTAGLFSHLYFSHALPQEPRRD